MKWDMMGPNTRSKTIAVAAAATTTTTASATTIGRRLRGSIRAIVDTVATVPAQPARRGGGEAAKRRRTGPQPPMIHVDHEDDGQGKKRSDDDYHLACSTRNTIRKVRNGESTDRRPTSGAHNNQNILSTVQPWYHVFTKNDAEYDQYMVTEWGWEKRGDRAMFEMLTLEGAQSGLSWLTILRKRDAYRRDFCQFDIRQVAQMTEADVERLLRLPPNSSTGPSSLSPRDSIVRHRGKIESVIHNAQCILHMYTEANCDDDFEDGVFDQFLWSFVDDRPILNSYEVQHMCSFSSESHAMSKALKKRGFKFVGPTTCYSLMQSVGMVIDHPVHSPEWYTAMERLRTRPGGYQMRK